MRVISSDWHLLDGSDHETCDREKVQRTVQTAIRLKAEEVILAGDVWDATRHDFDGLLRHSGAWFLATVAKPLAEAGVFTTFVLGNHDRLHGSTARLARGMYAIGCDPHWFVVSSGPEVRGIYHILHGHPYDVTIGTGGIGTRIGEAATRLVGFLAPLIGTIDPEPPGAHGCPITDNPTHLRMIADAYGRAICLVCGHTHLAIDVRGPGWRVLDCGSCTKGTPFSYVWISDGDETAGVEIER